MTGTATTGRSRARRRRIAGVAALLLVVAALVVVALVQAGDGSGRHEASAQTPPDATSSSAPEPTAGPHPPAEPAPVTPVAPGPTEGGDAPPPVLPAVDFDQSAHTDDGVTASVRSVEAIEGTGFGPGNIAGPALRVTVRLDNGTSAPVTLDGVAVDLTTGPEKTPASPLEDPSRAPFSGTVAPGDTAEGVYVFTVPTDERDLITVSVGYRPGAPLMVFIGSL